MSILKGVPRLSSVISADCSKLMKIKLTEEILEDIRCEGIKLSRNPYVERKLKPETYVFYADMWCIDADLPTSTFFTDHFKVFFSLSDNEKFSDLLRRKYPELLL